MDPEGTVTYELRAGVAWLGLNRPDKRNAIDEALLAEFEAAVRRAQDEARALVVFGHGACFSAGLDLAEHRAREPGDVFHHSRAWHAAFSLVRRGRIPAIAALHGATIGGGLGLASLGQRLRKKRPPLCRKLLGSQLISAIVPPR